MVFARERTARRQSHAFGIALLVIGATHAAVLSILEPIMMIFFALVLGGESLSGPQWLGIALVLSSLWVIEAFPVARGG